mmetsp:Transcript_34705/g.35285  ORF Transcript_34705/g.35285 Transcript_34705/m.35285 type:complete len:225 (-) Transcript_34705:446-1120(-)
MYCDREEHIYTTSLSPSSPLFLLSLLVFHTDGPTPAVVRLPVPRLHSTLGHVILVLPCFGSSSPPSPPSTLSTVHGSRPGHCGRCPVLGCAITVPVVSPSSPTDGAIPIVRCRGLPSAKKGRCVRTGRRHFLHCPWVSPASDLSGTVCQQQCSSRSSVEIHAVLLYFLPPLRRLFVAWSFVSPHPDHFVFQSSEPPDTGRAVVDCDTKVGEDRISRPLMNDLPP